MSDAVISELQNRKIDVIIATAAVSDWIPENPFTSKISTHSTSVLNVRLTPTPKIIDAVKAINPEVFLVAFRAEHELADDALIESAYKRLKSAHADLIVANDVGREGVGFEVDTNEVFVVDKEKKTIHISISKKRKIAEKIFDIIRKKLKKSSQ
jgi:phosphopantothenoylcysteine decarboxylase/phosphopantothenate--cysteine ligase